MTVVFIFHLSPCNKANKCISNVSSCSFKPHIVFLSFGWMSKTTIIYDSSKMCSQENSNAVSNSHLNFGLTYTTEAFYSSYIHTPIKWTLSQVSKCNQIVLHSHHSPLQPHFREHASIHLPKPPPVSPNEHYLCILKATEKSRGRPNLIRATYSSVWSLLGLCRARQQTHTSTQRMKSANTLIPCFVNIITDRRKISNSIYMTHINMASL